MQTIQQLQRASGRKGHSRVKHTAEELNYSEYQRSSEAQTKDHRVWGWRNDGSGLSVTVQWEGSCYCTSPLNIAQ